MKNLTLIDDSFNLSKTEQYFIAIKLCLSGYCLSVFDISANKFIALKNQNFESKLNLVQDNQIDKDFSEKIKSILDSDEFLSKSYKETKFIFQSQKSTLVPAELFEVSKIKDFFTFNHFLHDFEAINYNKFRNIPAYNIFALPSFLSTILVNKFKKIKFYHQSRPYLEYILSPIYQENLKNTKRYAFVHVNDDFLDIAVTENSKLILYNSFKYSTDNDFIYFILNTYEQLSLNNATDAVYLSGDIITSSPLYVKLKSFIKHIRFIKPSAKYSYSPKFKDIPEYSFINLYNLYGCE